MTLKHTQLQHHAAQRSHRHRIHHGLDMQNHRSLEAMGLFKLYLEQKQILTPITQTDLLVDNTTVSPGTRRKTHHCDIPICFTARHTGDWGTTQQDRTDIR